METIFPHRQLQHAPAGELNRGRMGPPFESPRRAEIILQAVQQTGLGNVSPPESFGLAPLLRVHDAALVGFLSRAYTLWQALGRTGDAVPLAWPAPGLSRREPESLDGRLGFYCADIGTPIMAGTWDAAAASADAAITAALRVHGGAESAFALCRPPGHHAGRSIYMGYSFLNNAAIAAQVLIDAGHTRVTVLDVDFHHGNGTQDIFYQRGDVQYVSLHADPAHAFPFFLGYADEMGAGDGVGATVNLPLPLGTDWDGYAPALARALQAISDFAPEIVVVSLGVDMFEDDPISGFRFRSADFDRLGQNLAQLALPTVFIMEGGYAVAALGDNVVRVLGSFEANR
jgi:acetoin utilization deacetylase AcuC-like enzyme